MSSDEDHKFSDNYMILRPEEASLSDLITILINRDVAQKTYIKTPTDGEEDMPHRGFIFLSLSIQKLLQLFSTRMLRFGLKLEKSLDFASSSDRNSIVLLLRVWLGCEVIPEIPPEKSLSFVGHLDRRFELDGNIKPGDCRYSAMLCAMASKLAYENCHVVENTVQNCWKMELLRFYNFWNDFQRKPTTQAFTFTTTKHSNNTIIIAFRGTEFFDADAWCTDIDISWYEIEEHMGKIHGGFMKALGLIIGQGFPKQYKQEDNKPLAYYTLRDQLKAILEQNEGTKFIVTGHSLGGALAVLFAAVLALHEENLLLGRLEGVYTFGQPRVGDLGFKKYMESVLERYGVEYLRFVYSNDVIPRLPHDDDTYFFKHFGTCVYYNCCYQCKIVEDEPDKNYIWLMGLIPKFLIACWELLRSFILPYKYGPDFAESNLLKVGRYYGLLFPGLSAHNMRDYINSVRLGSPSDILGQAFRTNNCH